jgi:hypothetical protein
MLLTTLAKVLEAIPALPRPMMIQIMKLLYSGKEKDKSSDEGNETPPTTNSTSKQIQ